MNEWQYHTNDNNNMSRGLANNNNNNKYTVGYDEYLLEGGCD